MALIWTEDLNVGVPGIDRQHQELFAKINQLLDACSQSKGKETVGEIIDFLGDYVVDHFSYEENFMLKYSYPDYDSHKAHHEQFIKNFQELKQRFESEGPGSHIVIMTNRVVVGWLNSHIRNVDTLLGSFLKSKI